MKSIKRFDIKGIQYQTRSDEGKKYITGLIPYNSKSRDLGGFTEVISSTAFNKTLSDGKEVRALFNHDTSKILGSTKSGTFKLSSIDEGLLAEVEMPNTSYGNDLYEIISRGDVSTMSFGFYPVKYNDDGNIRTLREVKLEEVSFGVMMPAYPETQSFSSLRSFMEKREINLEEIDEILKKEKDILSDIDKTKITELINSLTEMVGQVKEEVKEPVDETIPQEDTSEKDKLLLELEMESEL